VNSFDKFLDFWVNLLEFTGNLILWCVGLGTASTIGCHIFSPNVSPYVAVVWVLGVFVLAIPWVVTAVVITLVAVVSILIAGGWTIWKRLFEHTKSSALKLKESFQSLRKAD
jgi:hypothetical protein